MSVIIVMIKKSGSRIGLHSVLLPLLISIKHKTEQDEKLVNYS